MKSYDVALVDVLYGSVEMFEVFLNFCLFNRTVISFPFLLSDELLSEITLFMAGPNGIRARES